MSQHTTEPKPAAGGVGTEVAFTVVSDEAVDRVYSDWRECGLAIAQEPVHTHFAYTFTALDPNGHRLRILAPLAESSKA